MLLTDVVMPGMQGVELAARLTEHRPSLRTLYVSGFTEASGIYRALGRPGVTYLPKPFSAESLGKAVRAALDGVPDAA